MKVEYAIQELDASWHQGLDKDLKEKTVKEIFALLMPSAGSKKDAKKRQRTQFKKLLGLQIYTDMLGTVGAQKLLGLGVSMFCEQSPFMDRT